MASSTPTSASEQGNKAAPASQPHGKPEVHPAATSMTPSNMVEVHTMNVLKLADAGVDRYTIKFHNIGLESDTYITVLEEKSVVVVRSSDGKLRRVPTKVRMESAIMHPSENILALKVGDQMRLFDLSKKVFTSHVTLKGVLFWKWFNNRAIVVVTASAVYHWIAVDPEAKLQKAFDRPKFEGQIQYTNYSVAPDLSNALLNGLSPQQVKKGEPPVIHGHLQVHSFVQGKSRPIQNVHAACWFVHQLPAQKRVAVCLCFTTPTEKGHSLNIMEMGKQAPASASERFRQKLDLPDSRADAFPVTLVPDERFGVLFLLSKAGFLSVYHAASNTFLYRQQVSDVTMVRSCLHREGGIMTIDLRGVVRRAFLRNRTSSASPTATAAPDADAYKMSKVQREAYLKLHQDSYGDIPGVSGEMARVIMTKSSLPVQSLRRAWALADVSQCGKLNKDEFCVLLHLLRLARHGIPLPSALPPFLFPSQSGYPRDLFLDASAIEDKICGVCKLVVKQAVETACGHVFCAGCVEQLKRTSEEKGTSEAMLKCPHDQAEFAAKDVRPNNFVRNAVEKLSIRCPNWQPLRDQVDASADAKSSDAGGDGKSESKEEPDAEDDDAEDPGQADGAKTDLADEKSSHGCTADLKFGELDEHLRERCLYFPVQCGQCGQRMRRLDLEQHLNKKCEHRSEQCAACGGSFHHAQIEHHTQNQCPSVVVECPQSCGVSPMPRGQLHQHMRTDCPLLPIPCPFTSLGCDAVLPRQEIRDHVHDISALAAGDSHVRLLIETVQHQQHVIGMLCAQLGVVPPRRIESSILRESAAQRRPIVAETAAIEEAAAAMPEDDVGGGFSNPFGSAGDFDGDFVSPMPTPAAAAGAESDGLDWADLAATGMSDALKRHATKTANIGHKPDENLNPFDSDSDGDTDAPDPIVTDEIDVNYAPLAVDSLAEDADESGSVEQAPGDKDEPAAAAGETELDDDVFGEKEKPVD